MKESYKIEEIQVGMTAFKSQVITEEDVEKFSKISGDINPIHLNAEYAKKSRYKKKIAHGLLSSAFFSALFGTKLPGKGCVYVAQSLAFKRPVYMGDCVIALITVKEIDLKRKRVFFDTVCKVNNKIMISGEAEIFIP